MKKLLFAVMVSLVAYGISVPCAKAIPYSTLEVLSPTSITYDFDVDQYTIVDSGGTPSAYGDVTALLEYVPDFGDVPADFVGFTAGSIALIERGLATFQLKIVNAFNAGAVGVVIFDNISQPLVHVSSGISMPIPSLFVTRSTGFELLALSTEAPIVHLAVTDVAPAPEPATMLLFGVGLAGLAGSRLRRRKE